jgi:hypothetical protein
MWPEALLSEWGNAKLIDKVILTLLHITIGGPIRCSPLLHG